MNTFESAMTNLTEIGTKYYETIKKINEEIRIFEKTINDLHIKKEFSFIIPDSHSTVSLNWERLHEKSKFFRIIFKDTDKDISKPFGDTNIQIRMQYYPFFINFIEEFSKFLKNNQI